MKFGHDLEPADEVIIMMTKYGPAHAFKHSNGVWAYCKRQASHCIYCTEQGVPQSPPDPFDLMVKAVTDNWPKRWEESHRHPGSLADNEIWPAAGLHIVAVDDETKDRTVLVSFGDNDVATAAVSAIVHVHNIMIGRPD